MTKRITIKDIALAANVDPSTVSRAMQPTSRKVNSKTKEKILSIAEELGYAPNLMAQGLVKGSSNAIGIIMPNLRHPYTVELAEVIDEEIKDAGLHTWLMLCHDNPERFDKEINMMWQNNVRGLILFCSDFSDKPPLTYLKLMSMPHPPFPIVLVSDRFITNSRFVVNGDNVLGAKLAFEHLLKLGHRRIAMVSGTPTNSSLQERFEGFKQAHVENSIELDENLILWNVFDLEYSYTCKLLDTVLELDQRPTAMLICCDFAALRVMQYVKQKGISIPDDISVVGFGNISLCDYISEPLTTIDFSMRQMAKSSLDIIEQWHASDGAMEDSFIKIKPELIIRNSTTSPSYQIETKNKKI